MNDRFTTFDRAMTQAVLAQFADIPAQEEEIPLTFTEAFEKDVQEYLKYVRRRKRYVNSFARMLAIAAMVGILIVFSSLISIGLVVEPEQDGSYIFNMTSVAYGDYHQYEFYVDQKIVDAAPNRIHDVYYPTYIPEGFIPERRDTFSDGVSAAWETVTGTRIIYRQSLFFDATRRAAFPYDPEKDTAGVFTLGNFEIFRLKTSRGISYLWSDHQYYFELRVDAEVDEGTMQKIFESIEWMPDEVILED